MLIILMILTTTRPLFSSRTRALALLCHEAATRDAIRVMHTDRIVDYFILCVLLCHSIWYPAWMLVVLSATRRPRPRTRGRRRRPPRRALASSRGRSCRLVLLLLTTSNNNNNNNNNSHTNIRLRGTPRLPGVTGARPRRSQGHRPAWRRATGAA